MGGSYGPGGGIFTSFLLPVMVIALVLLTAAGVWYVVRKRPFGKLARLTNLASPTSVSFRQGTNVEFNSPGFNQTLNGQSNLDTNVPPLEGYSLEAVNNKSRDFSNPMYDAVQSGATVDTTLSNRSDIYEVPSDVSRSGEKKSGGSSGNNGLFTEPVSAIIAPSSITHKSSPTLQIRTKKLDPSADTGKDTQYLVEEDKTDC